MPSSALRYYARFAAVLLTLAGAGALLGAAGSPLLAVPTLVGGAVLYLFTAALFAYASFLQRDPVLTRRLVGGMGVFYILYGLFMAAYFRYWEFPYGGIGFVMSVADAAFGGLSTFFASILPDERGPTDNTDESP